MNGDGEWGGRDLDFEAFSIVHTYTCTLDGFAQTHVLYIPFSRACSIGLLETCGDGISW